MTRRIPDGDHMYNVNAVIQNMDRLTLLTMMRDDAKAVYDDLDHHRDDLQKQIDETNANLATAELQLDALDRAFTAYTTQETTS